MLTDTTPVAEAYDALADGYDAFTDDPRYDAWIRGLEALAVRHGLRGRRLLDAGCGTGKSIAPLLDRGYEVIGCDVSPAMLARARDRLPAAVELLRADVTALPDVGPVDLALALNDVLNYLPDIDAVRAAFDGFARCLRPGGLLVFDLNTPAGFATAFATAHRRVCDGRVFFWSPAGPLPCGGARVEIDMFVERGDGAYERSTSRHHQALHRHDKVCRALDASGLELAGVYGQHDDGRRDDTFDPHEHPKGVYVARRAPDVPEEVTCP